MSIFFPFPCIPRHKYTKTHTRIYEQALKMSHYGSSSSSKKKSSGRSSNDMYMERRGGSSSSASVTHQAPAQQAQAQRQLAQPAQPAQSYGPGANVGRYEEVSIAPNYAANTGAMATIYPYTQAGGGAYYGQGGQASQSSSNSSNRLGLSWSKPDYKNKQHLQKDSKK
ncbi:hypothetical protein M426DRAFT_23973 [Hypoxylon sp. CI-4A]|nr:hypothetical protein M426DRAFT_23973 [Hypoxylon sp. CI-4A]